MQLGFYEGWGFFFRERYSFLGIGTGTIGKWERGWYMFIA